MTQEYNGREFKNRLAYDLSDPYDAHAYGSLIRTLMDWFDEACEVHREESTFRHFTVGEIEVQTDLDLQSDSEKVVYLTIDGIESTCDPSSNQT